MTAEAAMGKAWEQHGPRSKLPALSTHANAECLSCTFLPCALSSEKKRDSGQCGKGLGIRKYELIYATIFLSAQACRLASPCVTPVSLQARAGRGKPDGQQTMNNRRVSVAAQCEVRVWDIILCRNSPPTGGWWND